MTCMKKNTQFDLAMELLITTVMMVKRLWRMFIRRVTSMNNTKRTGRTEENFTPNEKQGEGHYCLLPVIAVFVQG